MGLPFQAIRDAVARTPAARRVELAFLELMQPSLPDMAERLIAEGCEDLLIVPLFMAQGGHLKRDLPLLIDALRSRHPALTVRLTAAIGDVPDLTAAIARWVSQVAHAADVSVQADAERLARESVIAAARRLNTSGLSHGTSGNVSLRWGEGLLITPSGRPYDGLTPADVVWIDMDGHARQGARPSSEWRMHRDLYRRRHDVNAVVHAHPPYCTALAIQGREIPRCTT